jgi:hypothetical protein
MPEITAAVFGVGGLPKNGGLAELLRSLGIPAKIAAKVVPSDERLDEMHAGLLEAAKGLAHCDVLMINAIDDEIFPLEGAVRLVRAFPGRKRLFVWPGTHTNIPSESFAYALEFLRRALGQIDDLPIAERAW